MENNEHDHTVSGNFLGNSSNVVPDSSLPELPEIIGEQGHEGINGTNTVPDSSLINELSHIITLIKAQNINGKLDTTLQHLETGLIFYKGVMKE